jgi:hypothetical protein
LGVPDSRDFYVSPSEDDGTAPGAYSTTDLSSDDDTARRDSSSRETGAYLAPLHLPDFYTTKGLNRPLDIDDEESSTSAFSSVVGSDEEDGSDEDDMDEADEMESVILFLSFGPRKAKDEFIMLLTLSSPTELWPERQATSPYLHI